jgi:hypothetical protein
MPFFIGDIVELPVTTTQDYSLFHILQDFSGDVWNRQLESVVARHGLLSVIVHPDYLGAYSAQRAYRCLLERLSTVRDAGHCWIPRPGEVESWWRTRSRLRLIRDANQWKIEGEGKDRARIAYAELDGTGLVYSINAASKAGWVG